MKRMVQQQLVATEEQLLRLKGEELAKHEIRKIKYEIRKVKHACLRANKNGDKAQVRQLMMKYKQMQVAHDARAAAPPPVAAPAVALDPDDLPMPEEVNAHAVELDDADMQDPELLTELAALAGGAPQQMAATAKMMSGGDDDDDDDSDDC
jgi:hypothetical protein